MSLSEEILNKIFDEYVFHLSTITTEVIAKSIIVVPKNTQEMCHDYHKKLNISLFYKIFQDVHACIHWEYLEIIELEQYSCIIWVFYVICV